MLTAPQRALLLDVASFLADNRPLKDTTHAKDGAELLRALARRGPTPAMDALLRKVNGSPRYNATNQLDASGVPPCGEGQQ